MSTMQTIAEVEQIAQQYGEAARRIREADFDTVGIHAEMVKGSTLSEQKHAHCAMRPDETKLGFVHSIVSVTKEGMYLKQNT